jgi:hypothetical protein
MADPQGGMRLFPDGTRMGCARIVISSQLLLELVTTSLAITDSYTATAPLAIKCKARRNAGRYKYIRPIVDKHVGALETKKALASQSKPRLFVKSG